ncbi:MAG: P-loop NTPase [Byssovorax sp.]
MMTFDRVLPELLRLCEADPAFDPAHGVERACVVRDPHGRVRLVLAPRHGQTQAMVHELKARLEAALATQLEGFFAAPILTTQDESPGGKVARALLEKAEAWTDAAYEDAAHGGEVRPPEGRWLLMERRITKQGWLDAREAKAPWPLSAHQPPVVTFYSFKGGVGRTTALVSCALQLAEQGKRVAVLDLDLEAPGLGPLLGVDTNRGILDAIVDHLATGRVDLDELHTSPRNLGPEVADLIDVFPAGTLDHRFLEKLSRLDFSAADPWGDAESVPVHTALRALLKKIRHDLSPDYILLDARAGLHDIAGLSLHGLAHVDVLVTRASEQAYRGLNLTVQALGRRTPADKLRCVTVHGFAPPDPTLPEGAAEAAEIRDRAYKIFSEHVYKQLDQNDVPAEDDQTGGHWPWALKRNSNLDRFGSIASVLPDLRTEQHARLLRRIVELCLPESSTPDAESKS